MSDSLQLGSYNSTVSSQVNAFSYTCRPVELSVRNFNPNVNSGFMMVMNTVSFDTELLHLTSSRRHMLRAF